MSKELVLFLVLYGMGLVAYIGITTGVRMEDHKGEHFSQPITGIKTLLGGFTWPLALIWKALSKAIFNSGAPKPIQDPPKAEPGFVQPPESGHLWTEETEQAYLDEEKRYPRGEPWVC